MTPQQAQELAHVIRELARELSWTAVIGHERDYHGSGVHAGPDGIDDLTARLAKLLESVHAG
jgi:hypothetical protein